VGILKFRFGRPTIIDCQELPVFDPQRAAAGQDAPPPAASETNGHPTSLVCHSPGLTYSSKTGFSGSKLSSQGHSGTAATIPVNPRVSIKEAQPRSRTLPQNRPMMPFKFRFDAALCLEKKLLRNEQGSLTFRAERVCRRCIKRVYPVYQ